MSVKKKYLSIPCIDDVDLPNSLVNECREIYHRYGKYKLYDYINRDLNSYNKYSHNKVKEFSKKNLAKRYLYLYRVAMAQTMSFAYNENQYEIKDKSKLFTDDNVCPYCGLPLTLNKQIGSKTGLPKSHYKDVCEKYTKYILFDKIPEYTAFDMSVKEFFRDKTFPSLNGYSMMYFSLTWDEATETTPEGEGRNINTYISKSVLKSLDVNRKHYVPEVPRGEVEISRNNPDYSKIEDVSIFNFIEYDAHDNGIIKYKVVYKKNTDNSQHASMEFNYKLTLKDVIELNKNKSSVLTFLNRDNNDEFYKLSYVTIDKTISDHSNINEEYSSDLNEDKTRTYNYENIPSKILNPLSEEEMNSLIKINGVKNLINEDGSINVQLVYSPNEDKVESLKSEGEDVYIVDYTKSVGELVINILNAPTKDDIVFSKDSNGNIKYDKIGEYNFNYWTFDPLGRYPIIEMHDNSGFGIINPASQNKNYKYEYSDEWTYEYNDICLKNKRYFKSRRTNNTGNDPLTSSEYWEEYTPERNKLLIKNESILFSHIIELYASFYYNIPLNTLAYDDDCYRSIYNHYIGINYSYDDEIHNEYELNIQDQDTSNYKENIIGDEEYNLLSDEDKTLYIKKGESKVSFRGYINDNGSGGIRKDKIDIIRYVNDPSNYGYKYKIIKTLSDDRLILNDKSPGSYLIVKYVKNTPEGLLTKDLFKNAYYYDEGLDGHREYHYNNKYEGHKFDFVSAGIEVTINGITINTSDHIPNVNDITLTNYVNMDEESFSDRYYKYKNGIITDLNKVLTGTEPKYGKPDFRVLVDYKEITMSQYLNLPDEDKRTKCIIYKLYNNALWKNEMKENQRYDIYDVVYMKTIAEYNNSVGITDKSYAVYDVFDDATKETYKVYKYDSSKDTRFSGSDTSLLTIQDTEITQYLNENSGKNLLESWIYIPESEEDAILFENTVINDPNVTIYSDSSDTLNNNHNISENSALIETLDLIGEHKSADFHLSDYKGIDKFSCELLHVYKISSFSDGSLLIYSPSRYAKNVINDEAKIITGRGYSKIHHITNENVSENYKDPTTGEEYIDDIGVTFLELAKKYNISTTLEVDVITKKNDEDKDYYVLKYTLTIQGKNLKDILSSSDIDYTVVLRKEIPVTYSEESESLTEIEDKYTKNPSQVFYEVMSEKYEGRASENGVILSMIKGGNWKNIQSVDGKDSNGDPKVYNNLELRELNKSPNENVDLIAPVNEFPYNPNENMESETGTLASDVDWYDQYCNLVSADKKESYIQSGKPNFNGWIWEGINNIDEKQLTFKGLIEVYPWTEKENYKTLGYPRVLFPDSYNASYVLKEGYLSKSLSSYNPNSSSSYSEDSVTGQPLKLIRYCDNPQCYSYKKRLNKSKWSYYNLDASILFSISYYKTHVLNEKGEPLNGTDAVYGFSVDDAKPEENGFLRTETWIGNLSKNQPFNQRQPSDYLKDFKSTNPYIPNIGLVKDKIDSLNYINKDIGFTKTPVFKENSVDIDYNILGFVPQDDGYDFKDIASLEKRYILNHAGRGKIDNKRFEFEYKYATDEYSSLKRNFNIRNLSFLSKEERDEFLKEDLKEIEPFSDLIPIKSRPITEYNNLFKDIVFNTFRRIYTDCLTNNPYTYFNKEEIDIFNEVIKDVFGYKEEYKYATDEEIDEYSYIKFRLKVYSLLYKWNEYEYLVQNYWNNNSKFYDLNKSYIDKYFKIYASSKYAFDTNTYKDNVELISSILRNNFNYIVTPSNYTSYYDKKCHKIIIKKEIINSDRSYKNYELIDKFEEDIPDIEGFRFDHWVKKEWFDLDESTVINSLVNDTPAVNPGEDVAWYAIYVPKEGNEGVSLTDPILRSALGMYSNTQYEELYIQTELEHELGSMWYNGKEKIETLFKDSLNLWHEKLALPVSFICYMFILISHSRSFNIVLNKNRELEAELIDSNERFPNICLKESVFSYDNAVISKPFKIIEDDSIRVIDDDKMLDGTGCAVYDSLYIIYNSNGSSILVYSFLDECWMDTGYSSVKQSKLYRIPDEYRGNKIIGAIPFSNANYESAMAFVYDTNGILIYDVANNSLSFITYESLNIQGNISSCCNDTFVTGNRLCVSSYESGKVTVIDLNSVGNRGINSDSILGDFSRSLLVETSLFNEGSQSSVARLGNLGGSFKDEEYKLATLNIIGTLHPVTINEDPWILNEGVQSTTFIPPSCSDSHYKDLSNIDKDKYHINPKLTIRYAWITQGIDSIEYPEEVTKVYKQRIYTKGFIIMSSDENEYEIYYKGNLIDRYTYYKYSDEEKVSDRFMIYKITRITYSFRRLSLSNNGFGIYEKEMDQRLDSNKDVYAYYYKSGEEEDPEYGYKMLIETHKDDFADYYNQNVSEVDTSSHHIYGWITPDVNSEFGDEKNKDSEVGIMRRASKIFPIPGYISNSGNYVSRYALVYGSKCQIVLYDKTLPVPISLISEIDYSREDENEANNYIHSVIAREGSLKVYILYNNGRVIETQTYEYYPKEFIKSNNKQVKLLVKNERELGKAISYCSSNNKIYNIITRFDSSNGSNSVVNPNIINYIKSKNKSIVSIISCKINSYIDNRNLPSNKAFNISDLENREKSIVYSIN